MGGDSFFSPVSSSGYFYYAEEESLLGHYSLHESVKSGVSRDKEHFNCKLENGLAISGESGSTVGESPAEECPIYPISEAVERQRVKIYAVVLRSYEGLKSRIDRLPEAKRIILSYRPGSWAEKAGGVPATEYLIPSITTLLLVGPKGSGKSALVNKISWVLENDVFASERAQVSNNSGEGTYFLHEYMVPKGSHSFCLYDTRSLSADYPENKKMLEYWMTKGVRHGELVTRKSDNEVLKALLKCKDRTGCSSSQFRRVNFVIFVMNGLSVVEAMDGGDEKKRQYTQMIHMNFNNPLLSFKDDKPVVVVTHGDLLPLTDRVRVRVFLGELLGISPTGQIFDIPENEDLATQLAIVDMLAYCLERADRNIPSKNPVQRKVVRCIVVSLLLWMVSFMTIFIIHRQFTGTSNTRGTPASPEPMKVDWPKIRHCWLGE